MEKERRDNHECLIKGPVIFGTRTPVSRNLVNYFYAAAFKNSPPPLPPPNEIFPRTRRHKRGFLT